MGPFQIRQRLRTCVDFIEGVVGNDQTREHIEILNGLSYAIDLCNEAMGITKPRILLVGAEQAAVRHEALRRKSLEEVL